MDGRCSVWNDGRKEEKKRIPREETYVCPPPPNIYYYGWSDGRQERRGKVCGPQIVEPWCQLAEGNTVLSKGGVAGTRHQAMG